MKKSHFPLLVFLVIATTAMGQTAQPASVSLPFLFYSGTTDLPTDGSISVSGLGEDIPGDQPFCFDSNNDCLTICIPEGARSLAFSARIIGTLGDASNLALEVSTNGDEWHLQRWTNPQTERLHNGVRPMESASDYRYELPTGYSYIRLIYAIAADELSDTIAVGQIRIYDRKIHIGSQEWITYYSDESYVLPSGTTGYIVIEQNDEYAIKKSYDGNNQLRNVVPAGTPLLINGAEGDYQAEPGDPSKTPISGNYLHGNLVSGEIAALEGNYHYYKLANGANGLGWYFGDSTNAGGVFTMKGFKAYLALPYDPESSSPARQAPSFDMVAEETEDTGIATGMNETDADAAMKFVENGQIRIRKGEHVYTIMGMLIR